MKQALLHDDGEWWEIGDQGAAIPRRYQIVLAGPIAAVRMETETSDEKAMYGLQLYLDAASCRLLGEHLRQTAELLEAQQKPMN